MINEDIKKITKTLKNKFKGVNYGPRKINSNGQ